LQRVTQAHVEIAGSTIATIGPGLLVLIAVERGDREPQAGRLLSRILSYRVFPDTEGRMNLSLSDTAGGLLLVPQFTLVANTRKGTRPSFASAAPPQESERLFGFLVKLARSQHRPVEVGRFGAHMQLHLVNDGPVTFCLRAADPPSP
jgi:D-tyrosyl-tRNA(Tyr) deacylase